MYRDTMHSTPESQSSIQPSKLKKKLKISKKNHLGYFVITKLGLIRERASTIYQSSNQGCCALHGRPN